MDAEEEMDSDDSLGVMVDHEEIGLQRSCEIPATVYGTSKKEEGTGAASDYILQQQILHVANETSVINSISNFPAPNSFHLNQSSDYSISTSVTQDNHFGGTSIQCQTSG